MSQILFTLIAIFAAIILLPDAVSACSCDNPRPIDQKIAESNNIAVLKVVSIEKGTTEEDSYNLHGLKGATLFLFGSMYEGYDKDAPCPKMDALLLLRADEDEDLKTPKVEINTSADLTDQKLTFGFPKCKRRYD